MARSTYKEGVYQSLKEDFDKKVLSKALVMCGGNKAMVSRILGMNRSTVIEWCAKYNLNSTEYKV